MGFKGLLTLNNHLNVLLKLINLDVFLRIFFVVT
jgi:hypothetical protein